MKIEGKCEIFFKTLIFSAFKSIFHRISHNLWESQVIYELLGININYSDGGMT